MISTQDLYAELKKYEPLADDVEKEVSDQEFKKATIKLACLQIKLLHNLRTNMAQCMEKFGVEKVKGKTKDSESKE